MFSTCGAHIWSDSPSKREALNILFKLLWRCWCTGCRRWWRRATCVLTLLSGVKWICRGGQLTVIQDAASRTTREECPATPGQAGRPGPDYRALHGEVAEPHQPFGVVRGTRHLLPLYELLWRGRWRWVKISIMQKNARTTLTWLGPLRTCMFNFTILPNQYFIGPQVTTLFEHLFIRKTTNQRKINYEAVWCASLKFCINWQFCCFSAFNLIWTEII